MADKKISVLLSARDRMSVVFEKSDKSLAKLRKTAGNAGEALNKLNKVQGNVSAYRETLRALKETDRALLGNQQRLRQAKSALSAASSEQRKYQEEITRAQATLQKMDQALAKNNRLTRNQRVAVQQAKQALDTLQPALKKATANVAARRREDAAARKEMASLTAVAEKQKAKIASLKTALKDVGVDTGRLAREQTRLAGEAARATQALQKQERRLQTLNNARAKLAENKAVRAELVSSVVGTAVMAAPLVAAGKKAMDAEMSWAQVQKVAGFQDEATDKAFRQRINARAIQLGKSQLEMSEIVAAGGQAGVALDKNGKLDVDQLERFSVDAAKLSVAFDTDAVTAGDLMAKLRTGMKMNQDEMMDLADFINESSNKMAAKALETSKILRRMGANVKLAGFTDHQTAALASTLVASGETEETGATAMKIIGSRLTKGFATTKSARTALGMIGYNPEVLAKDMQRDAPKTLLGILKAIKKQPKDQQTAIISQIFGEEASGPIAKLAGNMEVLENAFRLAGDRAKYAGSMEKEYQTVASKRAQKIKQSMAALDGATTAVGGLLLPVVDALAPPVQRLAEKLTNLLETSERVRDGFKWMMYVGAALLTLKAGLIVAKGIKTLGSDLINLGRIGKTKLGMATDGTALSADRAAIALARLKRQLDRIGGGNAADIPVSGGRRGRSWRLRPGGRLGAGAMLLAGAGGTAYAMSGGDDEGGLQKAVGVTDAVQTGTMMLSPFLKGTAGKFAGRAFMPLQVVSGGLNIADAALNGSAEDTGKAVGDMLGGMGGMAIGAAIGTAILPGIGTAIGGALGGLAGGELGSWIGENVVPWFSKKTPDRLPAIDAAVKKEAEKQARTEGVPVKVENHYQVAFDVKASGDPEQDNALARKIEDILRRLQQDAAATGITMASGLDARLNASLSGQRGD